MLNGNVNEFVDRIYTCQDTVFIYKGRKYWFQGYMPNENTVHMEIFQIDPAAEDCVWEYNGSSICATSSTVYTQAFDSGCFRSEIGDLTALFWVTNSIVPGFAALCKVSVLK